MGVPGDSRVWYVGSAGGGIFKTEDGGATWDPIFDGQPAASIGALAVAPSDPNIVWAGTGEAFVRSNVSIGNGVYKSTDAGDTWAHAGLENAGRIAWIVIDPHSPDIVFAAVVGHGYGPQADRGVFRTRDGGRTWERVLFVDEDTGCSDIAMDPGNPQILFAGMWPLVIRTWGRESGGPGGGLYMSRDGGTTWKRLTGRGLPDPPIGKVGVAIAPSNPQRLYALFETADSGLWRSDDGGQTWRLINQDHVLMQRPAYYTRAVIAPDDENEVYSLNVQIAISLDGGEHFRTSFGGDNHDMWIDPRNPSSMAVGNDGGVLISVNRGRTWLRPGLPIAQMYHVATDNQIPYNVYGNMQDGSGYRGPSNTRSRGQIPVGAWRQAGGCETGFTLPDPVDPDIIWGNCFNGVVDRFDARTGHARTVSPWPESFAGWAPKDVKYRFNWTTPMAISPHDHNTVYVGTQYLHRTSDGGETWLIISPDLTTNDPSKQGVSGGLTPDNIGVEYASTIFANRLSISLR